MEILVIALYLFLAGGIMSRTYRHFYKDGTDDDFSMFAAFWIGGFFPISIPIILGMKAFNADWHNPLNGEAKHKRELKQIERKREIAAAEARVAVERAREAEALDRELAAAKR